MSIDGPTAVTTTDRRAVTIHVPIDSYAPVAGTGEITTIAVGSAPGSMALPPAVPLPPLIAQSLHPTSNGNRSAGTEMVSLAPAAAGDSKESASKAAANNKWNELLSAAERERVDRLFDPSVAGDDTAAIMDSFTPQQIEYFVETVNPSKMGVLQQKEIKAGLREPGATLTWRDLRFGDTKLKVDRFLNCSGILKPGQMLCVVGGADAGITSLLMSLARNHPASSGITFGDLALDGLTPDDSFLRRVGFVNKEDVNIPTLTVRETLNFSARLRMHERFSDKVKSIHVEALMKMMNLRHRGDVVHGNAVLRGISGGEKRRVSLATELIAQHQINVWDLPTNGLDSHSAYDLINMYKTIARYTGQSLVTSLVQPAPELLALFDTLLLMSNGEPVYYGPTADAAQYLMRLGYSCPPEKAIPDWLQEMTVDPHKFTNGHAGGIEIKANGGENGDASGDVSALREAALTHILDSYKKSPYAVALREELDSSKGKAAAGAGAGGAAYNPSAYNSSFLRQVGLCIERQATTVLRDRGLLWGSILKNSIVALITGSLFWQLGDGQRDGRIRLGLMFFSLMFNTMTSIQLIPNVMEQRHVMYFQASSGYFRRINFYIAYMLLELPQSIIHCFAYLFVAYPMVGLRGGIASPEFGYFALMVILCNIGGKTWALFLAAGCSTEESAHALAPLTVMLKATLNGYMVPYSQIPNGWIWVYYSSFLTYGLRGVAKNELEGQTFVCQPEELIPPSDSPLLNVAPPNGFGGNQICPIQTGIDALNQYDMGSYTPDGFDSDTKWTMLRNLAIFLVALNLLASWALVYLDHRPGDTSGFSKDPAHNKKKKAAADERAKAAARAAADSGNGKANGNGNGHDLNGNGNRNAPVAVTVKAKNDVFATGLRSTPMQLSWYSLCYEVDVPAKRKTAPAPNAHAAAVHADASPAAGADSKDAAPAVSRAAPVVAGTPDLCSGTEPILLLKDVFGYCEPGNMLALLGASGAGKSTLLDVLANKKTSGRISGELLVNGKPRDGSFSLVSGYVEQLDSLHVTSTVREALEFSARLRLPPETSDAVCAERVEATLDMLDLREVESRVIGSVESGGISPEMRKKCTIGVELVVAPSILFLDEPTTGLDALAALNVIKCVRKLARHISVICTVHQPSQEIVEQFDSLLLLKRGGDVVYNGPLKELAAYFKRNGYGECAEGRNIADFALEVSGKAKSKGVDAGANDNEKDMADVFLSSPEVVPFHNHLQEIGHNLGSKNHPKIPLNRNGCASILGSSCGGGVPPASPFWLQFYLLWTRNVKGILRNRGALISRMTSGVFTALIFGTFFYQLRNDQLSAINRVALCFITAIMPIASAGRLIPVLVAARPVFFRELQSKTYTSFAYWFARSCAELPAVAAEGIFYAVVLYFITNLRTDENGIHFAQFLAMYWIGRLLGFQWTETLSQTFETQEAATAAASVYMNLAMLFAGFFIPRNSFPAGWLWANYLSFFRYPISYLTNNELRDLTFECPDNRGALALSVYDKTNSDAVLACTTTAQSITANCTQYICPLTSGNQMLTQFDLISDPMGETFGVTVAFLGGFCLLSFLTLSYIQLLDITFNSGLNEMKRRFCQYKQRKHTQSSRKKSTKSSCGQSLFVRGI